MFDTENLTKSFRQLYDQQPTLYRAPGRVNLIGEHTDYNDGFVFPAAIDLFTWMGVAQRADRLIRIYSENLRENAEFDLDGERPRPKIWSTYVFGVALACEQAGYSLKGANLLVHSEVPMGAGVSSSAALEVAAGFALLANSGLHLDGRKLAQLCQKAENEYVGTRTGIMDQFASACCLKDRALLLDCRSLEFHNFPLPRGVRLVICNSMVKRELASSAYNTRRAECEEGVRILAQRFPEIRALRDASLGRLLACERAMPENVFRRCRHVITEDARVVEAADALEHDRLDDVREAMAESHRSLRDDYEVSCAELDLLVELANGVNGVHGARMTGAGFGGCTINLVDSDAVRDFQNRVRAEYRQRTGLDPDVYVCNAADGVKLVE